MYSLGFSLFDMVIELLPADPATVSSLVLKFYLPQFVFPHILKLVIL